MRRLSLDNKYNRSMPTQGGEIRRVNRNLCGQSGHMGLLGCSLSSIDLSLNRTHAHTKRLWCDTRLDWSEGSELILGSRNAPKTTCSLSNSTTSPPAVHFFSIQTSSCTESQPVTPACNRLQRRDRERIRCSNTQPSPIFTCNSTASVLTSPNPRLSVCVGHRHSLHEQLTSPPVCLPASCN